MTKFEVDSEVTQFVCEDSLPCSGDETRVTESDGQVGKPPLNFIESGSIDSIKQCATGL